MANTITNFLNTVAGRFSTSFNGQLEPHAAFLSTTTLNPVEPDVKRINDVVNIPMTTLSGGWADHQSGAVTAGNIGNTPIAVTLNKTPTRVINVTSQEISRLPDSPGLIDETLKIAALELMADCSASIGSLFTVGNFSTTGNSDRSADTGTDSVTRAQLVNLWGVLANRKVPVYDTGNLFAVTSPGIYAQWSNDADFTKADTIGDAYASEMRMKGTLVPINNILPLFDSASPTTTSTTHTSYTTAVFHRRATFAQFAYPEPPMASGVDWKYTSIMGIPVLMVMTYDTNHANAGGAYNAITLSTLWNYGLGRINHGVLDRTPFAAS